VSARRAALVRVLADGEVHAGAALAHALGTTRAAVASQVRALGAWGLAAESVPRRGYRLAQPLDLVDRAALERALSGATRERLRGLEVLDQTDSTNARLLAVTDLPAGRFDACLAEFQTAGRGRRGRQWIAPYGAGLCLSFAWTFREPPAGLPSLSLAVGVAVLRALAACGVADVRLKWPNDLLRGDAKLGGILCELRTGSGGPFHVVAGVGLNVRLPAAARAAVAGSPDGPGALPPASLDDQGPAPARTLLAARLLDALAAALPEFERAGFAPFRAEWSAADALAGRAVRVLAPRGERAGVARGIGPDGALLVDFGGSLEPVAAGDVSLRPAA
jgi:BirA family biotin operon repressor/biotin-[acetyl-CoA-carboxylase] ligase